MGVDVTAKDGFRALDQAAAQASSVRIELDEEYLRHIATVEAMAANQPGSDKTWVWTAEESVRSHYQNARRV